MENKKPSAKRRAHDVFSYLHNKCVDCGLGERAFINLSSVCIDGERFFVVDGELINEEEWNKRASFVEYVMKQITGIEGLEEIEINGIRYVVKDGEIESAHRETARLRISGKEG